MSGKIDFVLTWVDGSDENWLKEKNIYSQSFDGDTRDVRYRDWENLQYWFRGVEEYASWFNKIHFVTWGHVPKWLNTGHPKLNIVKHEDFIPERFLPTFSSHVIELNLHRIPGLAEQFVYFNDDTFLVKQVTSEDFFDKSLPKDVAVMMPHISKFRESTAPIVANIMEVINTTYDKNKILRKNITKWFNLKYKKHLVSNILMLPYKQFSSFLNLHLPNSYLKTTYKNLWEAESFVLERTCNNKFRNAKDVNQWLFKFTQLVEGDFIPGSPSIGRTFDLTNDNSEAINALKKQKYKILCLNDNDKDPIHDFEKEKQNIITAFNSILPNKSNFEI